MTGDASTVGPARNQGEFVLRTARDRGVRFIRLWFVDVLGLLKSFAIPVSELERALEEGVRWTARRWRAARG